MKTKKITVIFVTLAVLFIYGCSRNPVIPDELVGMWKTPTPIYEGCFFQITKEEISFGSKDGQVSTFFIKDMRVQKITDEEWTLYTISYVVRGFQKYEFPFYYHPASNGVIRFKNKMESVWTRESE
ncbi:MAG: hypothetical protein JSV46_07190 [Candidatus Aminicenantes bacterium]|nr:MAG: hypothetical protein JSV46_07190 [Candidatus Aminicenantes bacterium]